MTLKLNISSKGKSWKLELEPEILSGKSVGDTIQGKTIKPELEGYELEITGGSDSSGFAMSKDIEGIGLQRKLLTKGLFLHTKPRGLKKKKPKFKKGLRLRKTLRGKTISEKTIQVNINVIKPGPKPLAEIFPDQNKPKEEPKQEETKPTQAEQPQEKPAEETKQEAPKQEKKEEKPMESKEEKIAEEIAEEVEEEIKDDIPSSPETKTEEEKEEAAEKVAEEVKEDVEEVAEEIAEDEKKE